jgi:hypothetical protein
VIDDIAGPANGWLGNSVVLGYFRLYPVPPQVLQGYGKQVLQSEDGWPLAYPVRKLAKFDLGAQVQDARLSKSRAMIHADGSSLFDLSVVARSFREAGRLPCCHAA